MSWDKKQYCQDLVKFAEVISRYDSTECIGNGLGILYTIAYQFEHSGSTQLEIKDVVLTMRKKISGTTPSDVQSLDIYILIVRVTWI